MFSLFCFLRYLPFSDINIFNRQIRDKVHGVRGRRGPSHSTRSRGYQELKIAMKVRLQDFLRVQILLSCTLDVSKDMAVQSRQC